MKSFWGTLAVAAVLLFVSSAQAQQPPRLESQEPFPGPLSPELWLYQQEMRRYENPKAVVRRNAELAAAQRRQRIATLKWFGFSNSRPSVNPTPFGTMYSPTWISNTGRPYGWAGVRAPLASW